MSAVDLAVILVYFALTLGIGLWVTRSQRTAGDYFLGARNLPAWGVLLSIVATETSALTVISIPGVGARGDLTFLQLPFGYLIGRIFVARWLLPGYFTGKQETAYARLESRFGPGTRKLISACFLVTRFLGDGVRIFAGAIPLALVTGWSVPGAILAMGLITLAYTYVGGLKAVVWADVIQLVVYVSGGLAALAIAVGLAGGFGHALDLAAAAGKLRLVNPSFSFSSTYTLLGGLIGGALLSAASHGTDQLIVQRLLATRSLSDARRALIGSGVVVILQFLLFLLVGITIWAAGLAPASLRGDEIFPRFIIEHLPAGLAGLMIAGILAAAMSTISSSINALASSMTHDFYTGITGRREPEHLLKVGRFFSGLWGFLLIGGALAVYAWARSMDTPVVVLALSIASITYGALLGTYLLAGRWPRASSRDVGAATVVTLAVMLIVVFAKNLAEHPGLGWLAPVGRLAWPWYVPVGTLLTLGVGIGSSILPHRAKANP
ncbi:MAG TPA: sodium:solute symporter [Gemmatimonadales bacterium]|jgi:SSS family transporter|nr:sodium:solute symporter [Gemmatimonadales bacterium]